ncbi:MAG: GTP cyclohydrolase II [Pseudomonadota bacterium]
MFTYLDPTIRERLVRDGHLKRITSEGVEVDSAPPMSESSGSLDLLGPIPLPVLLDGRQHEFRWYAVVRSRELARLNELASALNEQGGSHLFASLASSMAVNSVLIFGDPQADPQPLVRVHSSCMTGDVFGSQRCECGPQFLGAIDRIASEPHGGMIIYMAGHEGRGIGLWAKAATYLLQDAGENTYEANRSLGLPDDCRDFGDAAALLRYFCEDREVRLLTNNPKKLNDLTALGIERLKQEPHIIGVSEHNRRYLAAKRDWGHIIPGI